MGIMGKVYGKIDGFLGSSWLKSGRKMVDDVVSSSVARSLLNKKMGQSMLLHGGLGAAAGAGYSYASDGRVSASSMMAGAGLGMAGRAGYGLYKAGLPGIARNAYGRAKGAVAAEWRGIGRRAAADSMKEAVSKPAQLLLPANVESIRLGPSSIASGFERQHWNGRTSRRRGI